MQLPVPARSSRQIYDFESFASAPLPFRREMKEIFCLSGHRSDAKVPLSLSLSSPDLSLVLDNCNFIGNFLVFAVNSAKLAFEMRAKMPEMPFVRVRVPMCGVLASRGCAYRAKRQIARIRIIGVLSAYYRQR